jgi:hypothetical protein
VRPGHETSTYYLSCSGGTGMDSTKKASDMLPQTYVFAFGGIHRSYSTLHCVRGVKRLRTMSHAQVGLVRFAQKVSQAT